MLVPFMLGIFRPPTQLFMFVLLLQHAVPTAINMSVRTMGRVQVIQGWFPEIMQASTDFALQKHHRHLVSGSVGVFRCCCRSPGL